MIVHLHIPVAYALGACNMYMVMTRELMSDLVKSISKTGHEDDVEWGGLEVGQSKPLSHVHIFT